MTSRRAKLRQLPIEDRNNMMSSRAIPEDFDMPHTLYPTPHTVVPQSYTAQEFGGQLSPVANDASRFLYPGIEENVSIMSPLRRPAMGQSINSPSRTRTEIKTIPTSSIATYTTERVSHIPSSIGSQSHSTVWHQSSRGHEDPLNSRSTSLPPQMTPQIPQSNSPIDELSTIEIDIANRSWEGSASPRTDDVFASYGTEAMVQTAYTGRVLSQREFEADASTFSSIAAFPYESSISSWKNLPLQGNNQLMIGRDHNEPPSAHGRLLRSSSVADFNPGSTYLRSVDQHPQFYVSRSASQLQPGGRIAPAGHTFMSCHVHDPPTAKTWTPDLPYQSTSLGPNQNSFSTNLSEGPYAEHTFGDHDIDVSHYVTRHGTEPED